MQKLLIFIVCFIGLANCTLKKVINHHGVHFIEKKYSKIIIKNTNKNDIIKLFGPPSTRGTFNDNLWIYIERRTTSSNITRLGKKELLTNDVVLLEFDNKGMLIDKLFIDKKDINKIDFSKEITSTSARKESTIYNILSSVREKINDPLGVKRKSIDK